MGKEQRRNIYAYGLLGSIAAIAFAGIISIWFEGVEYTILSKSIATFVVLAGLCGFLYSLTFNHDIKIVERLGAATGVLAVALSGLILAQIWFDALQDVFFAKIVGSIMIIGLLIAFVIAVFDDFFENKKLKDENYLD